MELWQLDVVRGFLLADGTSANVWGLISASNSSTSP